MAQILLATPMFPLVLTLVAAALGADLPPSVSGVGSILEQETEASFSLLQLRANPISPDGNASADLHLIGVQQTPCASCQSQCRATEIAFKNQCMEHGHHWDRCVERGEKRAGPCLDACPCSGNELADQEDKRVEQYRKEQAIVDGKLDKLEDEIDEKEEEAGAVEPPDSQLQIGSVAPDADIVVDFHSPASQQTPCEYCQSECLVVKIDFKNQCRERGHNWRRCEVRGEKRARPCLNACPCSGDELAGQEDKKMRQAAQEHDAVEGEIDLLEHEIDEKQTGQELEPPSSHFQAGAIPTSPHEDVPVNLHATDAQQTPCEFCQLECVVVEIEFKAQCVERGHPIWRCEGRAHKRARPCLDGCPCSENELEHQDVVETKRAQEESETMDRKLGNDDDDDNEKDEEEEE